MQTNDIDQDPRLNNICLFCKSSMKTQLEEFHSNNVEEESLLNSEHIKKILKKEVLYFCQNTSIRTVPRIVKTTNKASKILWISFFICLCAGLTVSLTFLIIQFRSFNVIHPPRLLQNELSPFPSFTMCNHRPLSRNVSSFLMQRNMRDPREFAIAANYFAHQYIYSKSTHNYSMLTPIFSLSGYLESIPLHYHRMLGHEIKDFVIRCLVRDIDY